jgi:pimeloyl-ACP methyl ester carboxylesterase
LRRATRALALAFLLAPAARGDELARKPAWKETYPGVTVEYGSATDGGGVRLRTIVTKPSGAAGRLPALFLVGWLSCDSVEAAPAAHDSTARMLQGLASRSGMLFYRLDKRGVGDSEGACGDTDFRTELDGYRAALAQLRARPDVDAKRIFVFGWSNGAGVAPLAAEGGPVAGYVVSGGWVRTWFEHMLEFERRQRTLAGAAPGDVNTAMKKVSRLYDLYLNAGMTPGAVLEAHPELASAYSEEPERQYGRPARFYQQLQELDLAGAWAKVGVPVLVVHGEFDFIMGREDHELIAAIVNARHPGFARFVERPRMDHVFGLHGSAGDGMNRMGAGAFDEGALELILGWLKERSAQRPASSLSR